MAKYPVSSVPPNFKDRPDLRYQDARQNQRVIDPGSLPSAQVPQAFRVKQGGTGTSFLQYSFSLSASIVTQIMPQKLNRSYMLIQNNSGLTIFIGVGVEINNISGLAIPAGGFYEPYKAPNNSIFGFAAGDSTGVIIEG